MAKHSAATATKRADKITKESVKIGDIYTASQTAAKGTDYANGYAPSMKHHINQGSGKTKTSK